jgi:acetylornithine deacetylase/succinyl-diaminopimelate desuccinylase-like protein
MNPAEKLLRELIALPSVNPAFMPKGDARAGEGRMADYLASLAAKAGLSVEFQEVLPGRSNLIAKLTPSQTPKRRVLLAPHLDTVGTATMPDSMFSPKKENGKLRGRGACDTKGSVAAMFQALLNVAKSGKRPRETEIVFAGLVDEEDGQKGSRAFAMGNERYDLAIVGEPTELKAVTAHKGDLWLQLETRGKAAHGAKPRLGVNAVAEMARIVVLLETVYARQLARRSHPALGSPTINVGIIAGGTQPNIVPAQCVISIDRRTIPGESETAVRQELKLLLKKHGLKAEILNSKSCDCLPMETDADLPLVSEFMKTAGQRKPVGVDFFCDASVLANRGIPSIVFGPGNIAQAHTADEWISLESLAKGTDLLTRFLQRLD